MNQLRVMTIFALVLGINGLLTLFLINSLSSPTEPAPSLPFLDHQAQAAVPVETPGRSLVASTVLTNTIYFPVVYNAPTGLYGFVTENGSPVSGIELELHFTNVRPWITVLIMTTTTQATGLYQFQDVPTYLSCTYSAYCMGFYDTYYTNSEHDPLRISGWSSNHVYSYTQGTGVHLSSFDLVKPELIAPAHGEVVTSTVKFKWMPRGISGDNYSIYLRREASSDSYETENLGNVGEYLLDVDTEICSGQIQDPCSIWYGNPLSWSLVIRNETGEGYAPQEGTFIIQP